ncbi:hypothetical protein EON77_03675 [bacterium]|nr:MAG: hypothetical protein EON77_03675 [bacterium]
MILLTAKFDRLSREHPEIVFVWMHGLTELGVVVATMDGDRRHHPDNLDMASIIEVVAEAQLADGSRRRRRRG